MPDPAAPPDPVQTRAGRPGLFLARDSYRQRRLRDVARMLPVAGAVIWLLPLMWTRPAGQTGGMAAAVVFVFAGWTLLIVLTAVVSRRIRVDSATDVSPDTDALG
ncbi:DUF6611 family protein [Loktanella sp. M215]|uniref:DUF6611 family protein n=1 Tax=Loktanella sp. M215 TaxID=2675431 RepID=UPI001F2A9BD5|nr:DUF6611 family protein [Loktanella sp. M215]MCF7699820.1 hypothetical protein [Loktanella sp. M215]